MSRCSSLCRTWAGLLIVVATGLLAGCGGEPTPPRLTHFSPVVLLVPTDETIAVRVVYEGNDYELTRFAWTVEAGKVDGDGAEVVYTAPSEPGDYKISVTAAYGEGEGAGELSLAGVIKVIPGTSRLVALKTPASEEKTSTGGSGEPAAERSAAGAGAQRAAPQQGGTAPADGGLAERADSPQPAASQTTETEASEPTQGDEQAPPAPVAGAVTSGRSRLDRILADKQLRAVVQVAFRPFSFKDDQGERVGFDVDLVREFARRWLEDPNAIELVPVSTSQRIPELLAGNADIVVAALTKTPERAEQVDFSLTYFKDGQRLLVAQGSEIADVCELAGQQVAAIEGSTSLDNLKREASACGFDPDKAIVVFERHSDAVKALLDGQVAAFTSDGVALENAADDQPLEVVGNHFSEEPYGIAVPKGDRKLLDLVNATLAAMAADGTFAAIYAKWFGGTIAPYPLEKADLATDPGELEPLVTSHAPLLFEPETGGAETAGEYVVQAGDTLSKIAGKLYGDVSPSSWRRIYEANRERVGDDPSRIKVGMSLVIPR
jgi:ABC-type amino acid transport substrate-binding protein